MRVSEAYPGKWIKEPDLGGKEWILTITKCERVTYSNGDSGWALSFEEIERQLGCNVTNARLIADFTGIDNNQGWAGVRVCLHSALTTYQGKTVKCIRIKAPPATSAVPTSGIPEPDLGEPPPEEPDAADVDSEPADIPKDGIPF